MAERIVVVAAQFVSRVYFRVVDRLTPVFGRSEGKMQALRQRALSVIKAEYYRFVELKTEHRYLGRYSTEKLDLFNQYQQTASLPACLLWSCCHHCRRSSPSWQSTPFSHVCIPQVASAVMYAFLESFFFGIMCWFMKKKYGITALYQLVFVLGNYWMTLHGKLMVSFVTILNSATVHHGLDFSLKFDFQKLMIKAQRL